MRLVAIDAAKKFIKTEFPECLGAILSGSVTRGEETSTSDLDIIIIHHKNSAYIESLVKFDWKIEVFVYDVESYKPFFESDRNRGRPSLPRMIAEGIVIKHHPELERIVKEAKKLLHEGPNQWDEKTIRFHHYFLSDLVDDFIGSEDRYELICIASTLLERLHEFVLRINNHWTGSSKWIYRELAHFDKQLAQAIFTAFNTFYETGEKRNVIEVIELILAPYGGKLFEGYKNGQY